MNIVITVVSVVMQTLGSGAFFVPAMLMKNGYSAYPAWLLTYLGALCVGLSFIKLGQKTTSTSLPELISSRFPRLLPLLKALYVSSIIVGHVFMLKIAEAGIEQLAPGAGKRWVFVLLLLLTHLNEYKNLNLLLSLVKIGVMLGVPVAAILFAEKISPLEIPQYVTVNGVVKSLAYTLFTFIGIEDINLKPKYAQTGMIIGSLICLVIYLLNTYVTFNYTPIGLSDTMPDQLIIKTLAPQLTWAFNLFLVFMGVTNINSWNLVIARTLNSTSSSPRSLLPLLLLCIFTKTYGVTGLIFRALLAIKIVLDYWRGQIRPGYKQADYHKQGGATLSYILLSTTLLLSDFIVGMDIILPAATAITSLIYLLGVAAAGEGRDRWIFLTGLLYSLLCLILSIKELLENALY